MGMSYVSICAWHSPLICNPSTLHVYSDPSSQNAKHMMLICLGEAAVS